MAGGGGLTPWQRGQAPLFEDARGRLTAVAFQDLCFAPARAYVIDEIPMRARRAGHACRTQHRMLIGLAGQARVTVDDGRHSEQVELRPPDTLYVAPATWLEIESTAAGTAILVLADGAYDPADYVDDRSTLPLAAATTASHTAET